MNDAPTVKVEAKPLMFSKTSIFGWLTFASGILLVIQQSGVVLPAKVVGAIAMASGIIIQILRFVTVQPVTLSLTKQVGEAPAPPWTPTVTGPPRGLRP